MNRRKSVIVMLIMFLAVGFATVSTTLVLNGILAIGENKDDFNIIFTKAKLNGVNRNNFISEDKKHINFISNELKTLDDTTILTYEVTNTSRNYDADVQVTCSAGTTELITFEYAPHEMEVLAGETKTGSLTASMFKVVDEATDVPIECTLTASAKERVDLGEEYIEPFSKSGVMMVATNPQFNPQGMWAYRSNVTRVIFEDKLIPRETTEELTFDVSDLQDKSVMAYLVQNGETLTSTKDANNKNLTDTTAYTLHIQGDTGIIANSDSTKLFAYFNNLLEIKNLQYLATSNATTMYSMFYHCDNLTTLDVSNFDTSNVTGMGDMFCYCCSLANLDLSNFDTSNVTTMYEMFRYCSSLTTLDVSNFNTTNVTSMDRMFYNCNSLIVLNLSHFDTSNVTNMYEIFGLCENLTSLDVSNWNTSNVTDMGGMFYYCKSLKKLDVSSFDTSNVVRMNSQMQTHGSYYYSGMFESCSSLEELDLSNFDILKVTSLTHMFQNCRNLKKVNLSSFNTSNITEMVGMFHNCTSLSTIEISNFATSNVTNMYSMFSYCINLTTLDLSRFDTSKVIDMNEMFCGCSSLTELNLSNFDTSNVTDMQSMFYNCTKLKTTITIKGTKCTIYKKDSTGNYGMFENSATEAGAEIIVDYADDASDLVDDMITTKSVTSNVRKGNNISIY